MLGVVLRALAMTHTTRANHVKASALGEFTSKRTRGEARHSAACDWSRPVMDPAECQAHPESAGALAVGARWEQFTPRIGASWTQTWQAAALRGLRAVARLNSARWPFKLALHPRRNICEWTLPPTRVNPRRLTSPVSTRQMRMQSHSSRFTRQNPPRCIEPYYWIC